MAALLPEALLFANLYGCAESKPHAIRTAQRYAADMLAGKSEAYLGLPLNSPG